MSAYNKEALDLMLSDAENRKCIDCGSKSQAKRRKGMMMI